MKKNLDLDTFVKEVLVQIAKGIHDANLQLKDSNLVEYKAMPYQLHKNMGDNKDIQGINFDIAVSASTETEGNAGAKITVLQVLSIGGGSKANEKQVDAHRIKFSVGLNADFK